ncbi:MAG TPA: bifunctional hydroxymethylpyrimidine kinase/phosphomethylpyrimidine kinase [Rhodanobacteraceae bacterium]
MTAASAKRPPVALTVAGSDPSGGAGLQADLKTFTAHGVFGTSVITALTAQNTHGVQHVQAVDVDFVGAQFAGVLEDLPVDASKSGMLGTRGLVEQVLAERAHRDLGFFTVDPVMVATSGHVLLERDAIELVRGPLLQCADLVTPNLPEAALLLGPREPQARNPTAMQRQAERLLARGARAVLLKGGHGAQAVVTDVLMTQTGLREVFHHPRVASANTHGTGCTLSAAITANVARARHADGASHLGDTALCDAVACALDYLARALAGARDWSLSFDPRGAHGPVDHQVDIIPVS